MQQPAPIPLKPPRSSRRRAQEPAESQNGGPPVPAKPKVKKLRLALVLLGLAALAFISTVFGMMMAVAHELPQLEAQAQLRSAVNSTLLSSSGQQIAKLTGNENRIVNMDGEISPNIKNAVIAIEDRRFYEHQGVDLRGMTRALWSDITQGRAAQGASTITQQFVKNALVAQNDRTIFQKLREAALAYHLEKRWSKQKILDNYLNTIYFGNGAYGVESAVRTYFSGHKGRQFGQNERLAQDATPAQAAMLAAMIASPSAYDPIQNPIHARERRDLVLKDMLDQHMITQAEYASGIQEAIPTKDKLNPPQADSTQPYFSSWVTQQLVDHYGAGAVFGGGLKVTSSLDPALQQAAEQAIAGRLAGVGPSASMVVIDNKTGAVKAMVGGTDFQRKPFNLATNGHRQPGSAIKPFILAAALQHGISPNSLWSSRQKIFPVPHSPHEKFVVNNFNNAYAGTSTLATALIHSDNSVFAEVGLKVGTRKVAALAQRMGIKTRLSTNPAMVLGGLKEGVTPLEMAYAYSTIANRGRRISGSFAASPLGPVAYTKVQRGSDVEKNKLKTKRVFSAAIGEEMRQIMHGVVIGGTGVAANVSEFAAGKTGTTENYGDAWFVGFTDKYTVAVWVGYPDTLKYMKTEYHGGPVAGGSFPAEIWHDFMTSAIALDQARHPGQSTSTTTIPSTVVPVTPAAPQPAAPTPTTPAQPGTNGGAGGGGTTKPPQQQQATPQQQPATPQQQPATPPPSGGGGGGGGGGPGGTGGGTPPGGGNGATGRKGAGAKAPQPTG
jgi:penicillin-binding protein 1A